MNFTASFLGLIADSLYCHSAESPWLYITGITAASGADAWRSNSGVYLGYFIMPSWTAAISSFVCMTLFVTGRGLW